MQIKETMLKKKIIQNPKDGHLRENRFLVFLKKKRRIVKGINILFVSIGVAVITIFFVELAFSFFVDIPDDDFAEEIKEKRYRYHPFLSYSHPYREVVNYCINDGDPDLKIYFYGGSAMWGFGLTEEKETIPSYVAELLCEEGIVADIKNFSQLGYVSTQEIIKLMLHLREDDVPDVAIFYSGANDSLSIPGDIFMPIPDAVCNYKIRKNSFFPWATLEILEKIFGDLASAFNREKETDFFSRHIHFDEQKTLERNSYSLEREVVDLYFNNVEIVRTLENNYNFQSFFYWQPTIISKKNLSDSEKEKILQYKNSELAFILDSYEKVHGFFKENFNEKLEVIDLAKIFDTDEDVFLDDCHTNSRGNKIIANKIKQDIMSYLSNKDE